MFPKRGEAGEGGLERAGHRLQLCGKAPRHIDALLLSQGKGVSAGSNDFVTPLCSFGEGDFLWEVNRPVLLLRLLASPQQPQLGCKCCAIDQHKPV